MSLTNRLEEHLTLIIFLIHRKERATQKTNEKEKKNGLTLPPLPLPRRPIEQTQIYFFLSWSFLHLCSVLVLVSCYFSCFCGYLICFFLDCADSEWINANLLFLQLVWTWSSRAIVPVMPHLWTRHGKTYQHMSLRASDWTWMVGKEITCTLSCVACCLPNILETLHSSLHVNIGSRIFDLC